MTLQKTYGLYLQIKYKEMKGEFIPYEQALTLKELGFDKECIMQYTHPEGMLRWFALSRIIDMRSEQGAFGKYVNSHRYGLRQSDGEGGLYISAPLWQQTFDWFRKVYELESLVLCDVDRGSKEKPVYYYGIYELFTNDSIVDSTEGEPYETSEDARLACLKELILIVKSNKCENI